MATDPCKSFQFTLDPNGTPTIIEDPIGWDEAEIVIKRDKTLKGLFINYTTDLEFHSDGYDFLKNRLDTIGLCDTIDVKIEKRCDEGEDFTTLYTGVIRLADIEVNEERCIIKARVEDDSLSTTILRHKKTIVPINTGRTLDGSVLATIGLPITFVNQQTGAFPAGNIRTCYHLDDVWQYVLDYITDNSSDFVSTLFESDVRIVNEWRSDFDIDLVAGNTITAIYQDFYGVAHSTIIPFNTNHATTMLDWQHALLLNSATAVIEINVPTWRHTRWWNANASARRMTMYSWVPFRLLSVNVAGGATQPVATITEITTLQSSGFSNVIVNGSHLFDILDVETPKLTLEELFIEMDKIFDIAMQIRTVAGGSQVTIERTEFFFNNALSVTLNNVPALAWSSFTDFLPTNINLGDPAGKEEDLRLWRNETWQAGCGERTFDLKNGWIIDSNIIEHTLDGTNDTFNKDDIFFVSVRDPTGPNFPLEANHQSAPREFHMEYFNTTTMVQELLSPHNFDLTNLNKLFNHFFTLAVTVVTRETDDLLNLSTTRIERRYKFEFPLTDTEITTILNNSVAFINFSASATGHKSGWIDELRYKVVGGRTKFNLLTEAS